MGNDYGFILSLGTFTTCSMCGRGKDDGRIVLIAEGQSATDVGHMGICEPCALLAAWRWRQISDGEASQGPFSTTPKVVNVLIVKDRYVAVPTTPEHPLGRISDPVFPFEVLMVGRREEPGAFGLPGGKVEEGETPVEAAVRELSEETGLTTWPTALEHLYTGFTPRGRLASVYLCRGYAGAATSKEDGIPVEWKTGDLTEHAVAYGGFYLGLQAAFEGRAKLHAAEQRNTALSMRLGKAGFQYVELFLADQQRRLSGEAELIDEDDNEDDDRSLMRGLMLAMSEEEKDTAAIVCHRPPVRPVIPLMTGLEHHEKVVVEESGGEGDDENAAPESPPRMRRPT